MGVLNESPPGLLPRRRLVERLTAALQGRTVLVRGPAGSGKSTLLALARSAQEVPLVRVPLDEACASPARLLHRLATAASLSLPEERLEEGSWIAERVRDELARCAPILLAFDDVHRLAPSPAAELLHSLVTSPPDGVALVLVTRGGLPFSLGAARARGRVEEIDDEALALSVEEVRDAIELLAPGVAIHDGAVRVVYFATRGWLVAVLLFAASLRRRSVDEALRSLTAAEGDLSEFLARDVLGVLDPEFIRIVECAAVVGPCDLALLESVSAAPVEDAVRAARSHHLLVEGPDGLELPGLVGAVVRSLLSKRPDERRDVHRRAAEALRERGELERSIGHWIEAGDAGQAVALLVSTAFSNMRAVRLRAFVPFLERLGPDVVAANPALRVLRGTIEMTQPDHRRAVADFEAAAAAVALPALAAAARARLAYLALFRAAFEDAERWARAALELATPLPSGVSAFAWVILEVALRHAGNEAEADAAAARLADADLPYAERTSVELLRGAWTRTAGDPESRLRDALALRARIREGGRLSPAPALIQAAEAAFELGDLDAALRHAEDALATASLDGEPWWSPLCRVVCVLVAAERGELELARQEAMILVDEARGWDNPWVEAEAHLARVSLVEAGAREHVLALATAAAARTQNRALQARVLVARAREAFDRGEPARGDAFLDEADHRLGEIRARAVRDELTLGRARSALLRGETATADDALRSLLPLRGSGRAERPALASGLIRLADRGDAAAEEELVRLGPGAVTALSATSRSRPDRLLERVLDGLAGPLDVRSLGPFVVERRPASSSRRERVQFRSARVADLLRFLLLHARTRAVSQEVLLDALWPDPENEARHRLHTQVSYLRRALEPHAPPSASSRYVLREGEGYRIDLRGGSWDADDFEREIETGLRALESGDASGRESLEAGLARYAGPLFEGLSELPAAASRSLRLHELRVQGGLTAAQLARDAGAPYSAERHLEGLLRDEPTCEAAWALRFEIAADLGRRDTLPALLERARAAFLRDLDAPLPPALKARVASLQPRPGGSPLRVR